MVEEVITLIFYILLLDYTWHRESSATTFLQEIFGQAFNFAVSLGVRPIELQWSFALEIAVTSLKNINISIEKW